MRSDVAYKIREKRKEAGISQTELSQMVGFHRNTIVNFELGKSDPKIHSLEKIAKALNVPIVDLLPSS